MRTDDAVRFLLAGGSLRSLPFSTEDTKRLAAAAKQGGGHLTIVGAYSTDDMIYVALAGPGHVTFDVSVR